MDIVTLALSKKYTNARLQNLATTGFTPVVVDVLPEPTQANSGNLYLVPANDPKDENKYLEYLVVENRWECIGSTAIDLSEYAKKSYVDNAISNAVDEAGQAFANYYTKEEVEQLIAQAVAEALGTTEAALDEIIEGGE